MCRSTINIGYEGEVFDCDFNQMLRMQQRAAGQPLYLWDITPESLAGKSGKTLTTPLPPCELSTSLPPRD